MANEQANAPTAGQRISPADIQRQEFGVSRFGGYRMRDVDEFLDRLTESTESILAENERLRGGGSPIVGTSDLDDVNRQADEIVERARAEAARILEEAREEARAQAAAAASVAAPLTDAQRSSVDPFLVQERAFLQSLATLVQGHAESVKGMARQARRGPDQPVVAESAGVTEAPGQQTSDQPPADVELPEAEDVDDTDDAASADAGQRSGDETVILDVPEPTAMGSERTREGDPSLRQLFWGEERS
jgi:DivIVA domain-containing protein